MDVSQLLRVHMVQVVHGDRKGGPNAATGITIGSITLAMLKRQICVHSTNLGWTYYLIVVVVGAEGVMTGQAIVL